jgi:hypothetical protein
MGILILICWLRLLLWFTVQPIAQSPIVQAGNPPMTMIRAAGGRNAQYFRYCQRQPLNR